MALLPWWDLDASVKEVQRAKDLGLRGVNTNADPQNQGLPDLGERRDRGKSSSRGRMRILFYPARDENTCVGRNREF